MPTKRKAHALLFLLASSVADSRNRLPSGLYRSIYASTVFFERARWRRS